MTPNRDEVEVGAAATTCLLNPLATPGGEASGELQQNAVIPYASKIGLKSNADSLDIVEQKQCIVLDFNKYPRGTGALDKAKLQRDIEAETAEGKAIDREK